MSDGRYTNVRLDQSIKARLEDAWDISTLKGDARIVAAHDFACHYDGSACHAAVSGAWDAQQRFVETASCKPDRENLHMLEAATELREVQPTADLDDFKQVWAEHMVRSPS